MKSALKEMVIEGVKTIIPYQLFILNNKKFINGDINTNFLNDSLLFMESIPSRETRWFIEKVLTKYWIYQDKNKKELSSLKMLANGEEPLY